MKSRYLTAKDAAAELGVSLPTLYAYVSRGLIRSEALDDDPRARRYSAEDIDKLKSRKESRHNPEGAVESALHLGMPLLESAITLITDGKLYYRGQNVLDLAAQYTLEQVAALIWTGDLNTDVPTLSNPVEMPPLCRDMLPQISHLAPFQRFQILLPVIAADDLSAYDLRPESVIQTGGRILRQMTLIACNTDFSQGNIAQTLCSYWGKPEAEPLISTALIFCADHELNASSFAARVVASTNAAPYAAVSGGLAALGGSKHGGHTERVEAFLREAGSPEQVARVMAGRLRRGEPISGFGHPLYPQGDPRGRELLRMVSEAYPDSPAVALTEAAVQAAAELIGEAPTIDMALVTLAQALELPEGSPLTLFALGRTIGWIGHALEQYRLDRLIRPRARYVGEKPSG